MKEIHYVENNVNTEKTQTETYRHTATHTYIDTCTYSYFYTRVHIFWWVKKYQSVRIRSFSGLYFSAFWLNTEIYSTNFFSIKFECGKIRTRKPRIRTHFTQWNLQTFPPKDTVLVLLIPEPTVCIVSHGFWIMNEMFLFLYDVIKK